MERALPLLARLALAVAATLVALLALQGARSLLGGGDGPAWTDADRMRAAAENPGIYAVHPDPYVGYALRPDADLAILDGAIRSDALGLRRRAGPPAPDGALRVALLGDSLAFGYGVDDDETIAHHLETLLEEARAPDERPVVCRTVAIPGWNHRNAVRFLIDHWPALAPDVVVYLPVPNDLEDTDGVWETGHKRSAPDATQHRPLVPIDTTVGPRLRRATAGDADPGPGALRSDVGAESVRRHDDNADSVELLAETVARRGGRLALATYRAGTYYASLYERLIRRGLGLPRIPLLAEVRDELTLGIDPHPNADTNRLLAHWIAQDLVASGWIERADVGALAVADPERDALRSPPGTDEGFARFADARRRDVLARLHDTIDFTTGLGVAQVYGGVHAGPLAGPHALVLLARGGELLELEVEPLAGRRDLYPLQLAVSADGVEVGRLRVLADGPSRGEFALPPSGAPAVDVALDADRWAVVARDGRRVVAAYVPVRVALR